MNTADAQKNYKMTDPATLHEYERIVLPQLQTTTDLSKLETKTKLTEIKIKRALQWLENKKLVAVSYNPYILIDLDENGKLYKKNGLPETAFLRALKTPLTLQQVQKAAKLNPQEVGACLGALKSIGAIDTKKDKELVISLTSKGKTFLNKPSLAEQFLQKKFPLLATTLTKTEQALVVSLSKRNRILKAEQKKQLRVALTPLGKKLAKTDFSKHKVLETLTRADLAKQTWKKTPIRPYDVTSRVPNISGGRVHPMTAVIRLIKSIFLEMGFQEMKGPWVESAFWCMDAMWIPQDHPARDVQDTFYLNTKGKLPPKALLQKVKDVHEHGGDSGSKGYGTKWDPEIASKLLLRTHTTATTYRYFANNKIKGPAKYFYVGKVFRNEAIDATHLPEFYQVEGFVMDDGLTLADLLGLIKEFYAKLGFDKIKFKPTYNPYTESSVEAFYYDEKKKKWIELINSGLFRPESLAPYGINQPVIAWGLGVERLAMLLLEQDKLKDIIGTSTDLDWLRSYKQPMRTR
ncbi:MAG: phenylalanyl-tRNA synthetase alpha chain [Candidatus Woesearchaeota archaeon]